MISVQQQTPDNDFCHFSISNVRFAFWAFFSKTGKTRVSHRVKMMTRWPGRERWPGDPMTQFHVWPRCLFTPPRQEYCDERVCVCVRACVCVCHIFGITHPIFTKNFSACYLCRGSVILWQRSDTLCISGFIDDVNLLISQACSTSPPSWSAVHTQPWVWL